MFRKFLVTASLFFFFVPMVSFAAVLQSSLDTSTAYTPMWTTGTSGYYHLRFVTGTTVNVKSVLVASPDDGCTTLSVLVAGPGNIANSASSTVTTDTQGHAACQYHFSGSGISLSAGTYYFSGGVNSSSAGTWYGSASGSAAETGNGNLTGTTFTAYASGGERGYMVCSTDDCSFLPSAATTRIVTVTPVSQSTIATSTAADIQTLSSIALSDYDSTLRVRVRVSNDARRLTYLASALSDFDSAFGAGSSQTAVLKTFIFDSVVGSHVYATTTSLQQIGRYTMNTYIERPHDFIFGINFGIYDTLAASTTKFLVSTSTAYDYLTNDNVAAWNDLVNASTLNCVDIVTTFKPCIMSLFVPNDDDIAAVGQQIYDTVFTRVPFGYISRFVDIMASSSPITMPAISYSFGSSSPAILQTMTSGDPIAFNIFDHFDVLQSIESDQPGGGNLWDIVQPYWDLVVAFAVLFVLIEDLLGMKFSMPDMSDDTGAYPYSRRNVRKRLDELKKAHDSL